MKYLYVSKPEENDLVLDTLRTRTGLEFVAVYNADHASEDISHGEFNGVFMGSLSIPNSSGGSLPLDHHETGLMVAYHAKRVGLPLIVLTGADAGIRRRLEGMGADAVHNKPCNPEDYIASVKSAFGELSQ